ncbi:hypothetical protein D9615_002734 [Tricholomella constricta]|uniref:C3H1-type domain-containing protein n=1 Tax=Tricholomella constricta TaxID=117010 RepID=A0A8H5M6B6_9AGAR|nr:hypothetical protein D9615_002734 [Tricholomella constricta]
MQACHRKPPLKKRHTKPCRFFQTSRCPLSAQECDFAHILSNEAPLQSPNLCRYYAAGRCGNGSSCRFRHVMERSEGWSHYTKLEDMKPQQHSKYRSDIAAKLVDEQDVETAIMLRSPSTSKKMPVPIEVPPPFDARYPASPTGWRSPYVNPLASPIYSPRIPPPQLYYSEFFSHSAESSATLSTSTSSSLSDDVIFVTDDPKYNEHHHQYQSQVRIADEQPHIHVPPFNIGSPSTHVPVLSLDTSYPTLPNMYGTYGFQQPISPSFRSVIKTRTQSRSASRHKAVNYRTKPCRFYKADGSCPNGSECTFIHDEPSPVDSPLSQSEKLPPCLPPKPVSLIDENKKKNFFPISWRVIGGGVLMGEPKTPPATQDVNFQNDEMTFRGTDKKENRAPTKPLTRTRSTSTPPTPTTTQVKVESLFSAESPGNL